MTYQITIGNQIFSNVPFSRWQEIKDTKMYDLVTIDGREYRRSEVRCNTITTAKNSNSQEQHSMNPEAYTPLDEFQTIKFHLLSGLIGKTPIPIHLHACEDISAFWVFYKPWVKANLQGQSIRQWLSAKSDSLEGRVARCQELYDIYLNQKTLASARNLPF